MDLYALPPEEFTSARDAAAKQDRTLKALRRPTVAAWVVNTLVRREPALVKDLVALGQALAEAQRAGRAADLRELAGQRHALVDAVTTTAVGLVGRPVTDAVRVEVAATLDAALADPSSAEAVRSGQLVRALSFAGFGGVDLDGAVAPLPRPQRGRPERGRPRRGRTERPRTPASRRSDTREAERAALDAAGVLDDAVRAAEQAARERDRQHEALESAQEGQAAAAQAVDRARAALEEAERGLAAAASRRTEAERALEQAAAASARATEQVLVAQAAEAAARAALDALRRG